MSCTYTFSFEIISVDYFEALGPRPELLAHLGMMRESTCMCIQAYVPTWCTHRHLAQIMANCK